MKTSEQPVTPSLHGTRFVQLRTASALIAAAVATIVVLLAAASFFPASSNFLTLGSALAWTSFAPHLVLVSSIAALLCIPLWRSKRRHVLRGATLSLTVVALVASTSITARLVNSATTNGGSVDLVRSLVLTRHTESPTKITNYVTVDGATQEARIYEPAGGPGDAPVMMYIHGGGWYIGSAEESESMAQRWADEGWYVVSVNYRLADVGHATWDKAPADVACALTWTVKRASEAGADTSRLTVIGDSAGGHLAMLLGWSAAAGAVASSCPEAGAVPVAQAVVAGYPVSNIDYTYDHGAAPRPAFNPREFIRLFLGGAPADVRNRVLAVSPSTYLSKATPPTLVVQPEGDDFIPAKGNVKVMEEAQKAGVDATIVSVPFSWHGFDSNRDSIGGQIKNSVVKTWLEKRDLAPHDKGGLRPRPRLRIFG